MDRERFLSRYAPPATLPLAGVCTLLVVISAAACVAPGGLTAAEPLNVVFFLTDDQRPDAIGALGGQVATPHTDRLIERGFTFRHAYTMGSMVGAVCLPSRTQLLTGMSMFRARNEPSSDDSRRYTLPRALRAAGYASLRTGKQGNHPDAVCREFDEYVSIPRRTDCSTEHADRAIAWIDQHAGQRPFFVLLSFATPHDPQPAPDEYYQRYRPETLRLSANFRPVHPFDNGELLVRDELTLPLPRSPDEVRAKLARYFASITYTDDQIGRVLAALDKAGVADRTLVVFASDNGLSLGDHGLLGKQNLYEQGGMHVPLVVAGPGVPHGASDALVYLFDLFPTICELAGFDAPAAIDGRSLAGVIQGRARGVREAVLTAYKDIQRGVRDDRWKLIRYPQIDRWQLFDLDHDPAELNDLAGDPRYAERLEQMQALLVGLQREFDDPCPLVVDEPQTGEIDLDELRRQAEEAAETLRQRGQLF